MADEQLKQQVDQYVEEVWEDVVEDIRSLVRIESVENLEAAEPGQALWPQGKRRPSLPPRALPPVLALRSPILTATSALETCPASPTRI